MDEEIKTSQLEIGEPQLTSLYMMKELAKNETDLAVDSDSQVEKTKMSLRAGMSITVRFSFWAYVYKYITGASIFI